MTYDAIIVGAGPAGSATALMLARAGWSVALAEKAMFPRRKVCGEFISATSMPLLNALGVEDAFRAAAGPEVRRVGLFAKDQMLSAPMPRGSLGSFGRALGREHLDALLLSAAARAGATVWQPWRVTAIERRGREFFCTVAGDGASRELAGRVVIAATGSWERGPSPLPHLRDHRPSDLLAFKAHFRHSDLPADLMPLVAFPGGYGGMVHTDDGRVSLSCCIRRDALQGAREREREPHAADAVLTHIKVSCLGVRQALRRAALEDIWLSAGPIRPGMRSKYSGGIFRVGNLAGEAHPVVAEGISMALQSAWLLCRRLIAQAQDEAEIARAYDAEWRSSFALRIRAASLFAQFAMRPGAVALLLPVLRAFPKALTFGAHLSGKSKQVVTAS